VPQKISFSLAFSLMAASIASTIRLSPQRKRFGYPECQLEIRGFPCCPNTDISIPSEKLLTFEWVLKHWAWRLIALASGWTTGRSCTDNVLQHASTLLKYLAQPPSGLRNNTHALKMVP
jgi:hypothetical protein